MTIGTPRNKAQLDLTDLPAFVPPVQQLTATVAGVVVDAGLLALFSLMAFAAAFFAFLRYDIR
jgi:hypothetical protein